MNCFKRTTRSRRRFDRAFPRPGWLVAAFAATVLVGCIDLVPVEPPRSRAAALSVSIDLPEAVASGGSGTARLTASLDPGVSRTGIDRRVLNDTLAVMGQRHAPGAIARGQYRYAADAWFAFDELAAEGIAIEPPIVEEAPSEPLLIRWPIARHVGPDTMTLQPGADLVLRLEFDRRFGRPRVDSRRWSATLFRGEEYASRGGLGLPPEEIRFRRELLGPPGAALTAVVNVTQTGSIRGDGGDYVTRVTVSQRLEWRVDLGRECTYCLDSDLVPALH